MVHRAAFVDSSQLPSAFGGRGARSRPVTAPPCPDGMARGPSTCRAPMTCARPRQRSGHGLQPAKDERKAKADVEVAAQASDRLSSAGRDAERLIAAWNELPAPANALAVRADDRRRARGYCPACRTTLDIDLRTLDRHRDAAVTSLIPSLSCRSCRPHAPFDGALV
jgi:hypothetical protein